MRILVTGKDGQVGRCLMVQGAETGFEMFGFSSSELNITNIRNVDAVFSQVKPDLVINAAAYTAVDKAENDQVAAYAVNELGPKILANKTKRMGIPLFHISTDYVFDGERDLPYVETDSPNPQSVYGRSKLMGEEAVKAGNPKNIILRTSWVFSEYGNNFVKTMLRIGSQNEILKIVNDQIGCPTSAHSIADVLLRFAKKVEEEGGLNWGVYHHGQLPLVSWYDFSLKIFEIKKAIKSSVSSPELLPIPSSSYPQVALRPKNSTLNSAKLNEYLGCVQGLWLEDLQKVLDKLLHSH